MSQLLVDLDGARPDTEKSLEDAANISKLVETLNENLNKNDIRGKSKLIGENIEGILKGLEVNRFIQYGIGVRINCIDDLISNKLVYIMSLDGGGRSDFISIVKAIQAEIQSLMPPTIIDKMIGGDIKR